jgi:hypothetical protein
MSVYKDLKAAFEKKSKEDIISSISDHIVSLEGNRRELIKQIQSLMEQEFEHEAAFLVGKKNQLTECLIELKRTVGI